jgi:hypothetical protein
MTSLSGTILSAAIGEGTSVTVNVGVPVIVGVTGEIGMGEGRTSGRGEEIAIGRAAWQATTDINAIAISNSRIEAE